MGDWLTCFPGFAMLTADEPAPRPLPAGPGGQPPGCGELVDGHAASRLRWPDGETHRPARRPAGVTGIGDAA